jgi:hypothetical protein
MKTEKYSWETIGIAISFIAVWIYFLIRIWAGRAEIELSPFWQLLLLPALIAMLVIFVRRMKRVVNAIRGNDGNAPDSFINNRRNN